MSLIAIAVASMTLAAGGEPLEWRQTEMAPQLFAATAFTGETDGLRQATVVLRSRVDRMMPDGSGLPFRAMVFHTEVNCGARTWRILGTRFYGADYAVVGQSGAVPGAPLVRETPLHAAVTDVCDGGHTGPVALTTDDVVEVQRWLDGL